jgi:hypothetical protein
LVELNLVQTEHLQSRSQVQVQVDLVQLEQIRLLV